MTDYYLKYLGRWHRGMTEDVIFRGLSLVKGPMTYETATRMMESGEWDLLRVTTYSEQRILDGFARPENLRQFIQKKYPVTYERLYDSRYD